MEENEVMGIAARVADSKARIIESLTEAVRQIVIDKGKQHGQSAVAKALQEGKPCSLYEFKPDHSGELSKPARTQIRLFRKELEKKGVDYAEVTTQDGAVLVLIKGTDIDLARDAAHKANINITKEYMDKNPDKALDVKQQDKEKKLRGKGKDRDRE